MNSFLKLTKTLKSYIGNSGLQSLQDVASGYRKFTTHNILLWRQWHYFSVKIKNSHGVTLLFSKSPVSKCKCGFSLSIMFYGWALTFGAGQPHGGTVD